MDIEKRTDEITEQIYAGYGSGTGVLFGIPSSLRDAVRAVVKIVLRVEYKEGLKEGVTRFAWWKELLLWEVRPAIFSGPGKGKTFRPPLLICSNLLSLTTTLMCASTRN